MTEMENNQEPKTVLTAEQRKNLIINTLLVLIDFGAGAVVGTTAFAILTEVANERPEFLLSFILANIAALTVGGISAAKTLERMKKQ